MDTKREYEESDEFDGYNGNFDDPSIDVYCTNLCRSDEKEWKRKELKKKERTILR